MNGFEGAICLITGASSGIGAAFAGALAHRGAHLVLVARRADRLTAIAAELPGEPTVIVGDITRPEDRQCLLDAALTRWGRVDLLVNNAGRGEPPGGFAGQELANIEAVLSTNLLAAIYLTHALLPHMPPGGAVVNVSSPMGALNLPPHTLYCLTKAGLSSFSESLRRELRPTGIHVMDLRPGFTRSELITEERARSLPPLEPIRSPEYVAQRALKGLLRGQAVVFTGGPLARLGMVSNRTLPRLVERVVFALPERWRSG